MPTPFGLDHSRNQKLLTEIIDERAETEPDAVWLEYPKSETDYAAGFAPITYRSLANAINGLAWHLQRNIGKATGFPTLPYIGPNDARYALILYACIKAGYKVFFSSPKNSVPTHLELFDTLECSTLVTTKPMPVVIEDILSTRDMSVVYLPSLEELLESQFEPYPFTPQARSDPFVVLHTSGSTGSPKPVIYTHEFVMRNVNALHLPGPEGFLSVHQLFSRKRFICLLPLFHMAGYFYASVASHFNRATVILPSPGSLPTAETLHAMLEQVEASWATVSPITLDNIGRDPDLLQAISGKLERIGFLGGNPSRAMGDEVSRRLKICNLIGSSECGGFAQLVPDDNLDARGRRLWPYVNIDSRTNSVFKEHAPGLYELVVKHDSSCEEYQPVFALSPELEEFRTKDLFTPHPSEPNFWEHMGRIDDIIVFLNGEKTNPLSFESSVAGHPDVAGALVFGTGRMEAGILIELASVNEGEAPFRSKDEWLDRLWPAIEAANSVAPTHARIEESHVCFVSPEKPMARAAKGTVRRQETLRLYAEEIEAIYQESDLADGQLEASLIDLGSVDEITAAIRSALGNVMKRDAPPDDTDFFSIGMDSLQVIRLVRQLRRVTALPDIVPLLVYENPSVSALAKVLQKNISNASTEDLSNERSGRLEVLHQTIKAYKDRISHLMPVNADGSMHKPSGSHQRCTVLVTGTTGFVGSYILDQLLSHPSSPNVICLNRSSNAMELQISGNKLRDASLATRFPAGRVKFLATDCTSETNLGLSDAEYRDLQREVTLVIHSAWPVDFNVALSAFRPALDGLVNVVRFCESAICSPRLIYISSISAAMNLQSRVIPEMLVDDLEAPMPGYGESKFVAEHVLSEASRKTNIRASIIRVGQVSGATGSSGRWSGRDWLPRMVLSSRYLGAIPKELGVLHRIDWIPVDVLAKFIMEVSWNCSLDLPFEVYHAVNPNVTSWTNLLPSVVQTLETSGAAHGTFPISCISTAEWVQRLRRSASDLDDADEQIENRNPALMLLHFFEETFGDGASERAVWSTQAACKTSESLRSTECIQPGWMERWARGWLGGEEHRPQ